MARPYSLVLFGASGFTGEFCAEHIATHAPTDLRWAVAGRSATKLQSIVDKIRALNPDRALPATEICGLEAEDVASLASKTDLLVNCVGPYSLYGEPVFRACAEAGTSYIDTTGEVPWVARMIERYGKVAEQTGAILVPQCGFESSASDMLVWCAIKGLRDRFGVGAGHVSGSLYDSKMQASGGTLATIFTQFDVFSLKDLVAVQKPFALSPVKREPDTIESKAASMAASGDSGILARLTGTFIHPVLGPQGAWLMGTANAAIVQRSWGLWDRGNYYGRRFNYSETLASRSRLVSLAINIAMALGTVAITLAPIRWIARRLVTQPGFGPSRESDRDNYVDLRAVAEAEDGSGRRVMSRLLWSGSVYHLTAVLMIEAALTLLKGGQTKAKEIGGGVMTPATLGEEYAERLRAAGITLEEREI